MTTDPKTPDQAAVDTPLDGVHTELRPQRGQAIRPAPRAKTMPPELDDDDDLFNDMPV